MDNEELLTQIDKRFDTLTKRMDKRFEQVDKRFEQVDEQLETLQTGLRHANVQIEAVWDDVRQLAETVMHVNA